MHLLKKRSTRFYLGFLFILAMTLGGAAIGAFADTPTAQVAVSGAANVTEQGPASVTASSVTLDGTDKTATYTMNIAVADNTGTGNGWHVTIDSTQFSTGVSCGTGHTLSGGASKVTGATFTHNGTGTYTDPTNSVNYTSLTVPAGCPSTGAVELFNAASNSGLGQFTITPAVSISIPANTYAGTYTSTVTLGIATGP